MLLILEQSTADKDSNCRAKHHRECLSYTNASNMSLEPKQSWFICRMEPLSFKFFEMPFCGSKKELIETLWVHVSGRTHAALTTRWQRRVDSCMLSARPEPRPIRSNQNAYASDTTLLYPPFATFSHLYSVLSHEWPAFETLFERMHDMPLTERKRISPLSEPINEIFTWYRLN